MHFSIPDTKECTDENGSTYLAYNIKVNGWQHCSLRYRQLLSLHQLLQRELPSVSLPAFPPKKILPLSSIQTEDRRHALEKYILALSQEPRVLLNHHFNGFLACAQHESYTGGGRIEEVPLQVYLMNGQRIVVTGTDALQTQHLLQMVCKQIGLPLDLMNYFALFLVRKKDGELTLVKKLHNFECPYISQKSLRGSYRIVLRRNYWVSAEETAVEQLVTSDPVGLGLVYGQVVAEVQHGWVLVPPDQHNVLAQLQARGHKREYLELARTFKYYGSVQFSRCICDFPSPNTSVTIAAGCNELNFRIDGEDGQVKEGGFKVTRMRCWRISTHQTSPEAQSPSPDQDSSPGSSCQVLTESRQNSTASNSSGFSSSHSLSPDSTLPSLHRDTDPASSFLKHSTRSNLASPTNGFGNGTHFKEASNSPEDITRDMLLPRSETEDLGAVLELSFEYLLRAGELRWVRVLSSQAVLMSLCLQSMVQQLLSSSSGTFPSPPPCPAVTELPIHYTKADGSSVLVYTHNARQPRNNPAGLSALGELSLRRLTEKFADLNGTSNSSADAASQQEHHEVVVAAVWARPGRQVGRTASSRLPVEGGPHWFPLWLTVNI